MQKSLFSSYRYKSKLLSIDISMIALTILFFAETSYYLLILQTGIVDYFHTDITKIWMMPVGGILGILTISQLKQRAKVVSMALFFQTVLMFFYPHFHGVSLFILGFLSGLVAPYLIYQLKNAEQMIMVLGLSYLLGTFAISIAPEDRGLLAVTLSVMAWLFSYLVTENSLPKRAEKIEIKIYLQLVLWLVLDATLFGILAKSDVAIWGNEHYTFIIALFHAVGLYMGYRLYDSKFSNKIILSLFILSYLLFALGDTLVLAIIYPIVISYYNVIVLKYFMRLSFGQLALASLSLWFSAGLGLFLTLSYLHFI